MTSQTEEYNTAEKHKIIELECRCRVLEEEKRAIQEEVRKLDVKASGLEKYARKEIDIR